MAEKKRKLPDAAIRHQKHFWGALLLGLVSWIFAAALPVKYSDVAFIAQTSGIFAAFMPLWSLPPMTHTAILDQPPRKGNRNGRRVPFNP